MSGPTNVATAPGSARASRAQFGASPNYSSTSDDLCADLSYRLAKPARVSGESPETARGGACAPRKEPSTRDLK